MAKLLARLDACRNLELDGVAVDPAGNVWVPDARLGQYLIFAPDGTFLEAWGTPGSGDGEFAFTCAGTPYGGIAFDATGAFYVADSGNFRIQKFGPDRTFRGSWGSFGSADDQFACPAALALDAQGRVYVADQIGVKSGGKIGYAYTRYQTAVDEGAFDNQVIALLRNTPSGWLVYGYSLGATDVPWEEWRQAYPVPPELFQGP